MKTLCGYETKQNSPDPEDITYYVSKVNVYFVRFEKDDAIEACNDVIETMTSRRDERIVIDLECVVQTLKRVRTNKATGPDRVPVKAHTYCAGQLTPVLQTLFKISSIKE